MKALLLSTLLILPAGVASALPAQTARTHYVSMRLVTLHPSNRSPRLKAGFNGEMLVLEDSVQFDLSQVARVAPVQEVVPADGWQVRIFPTPLGAQTFAGLTFRNQRRRLGIVIAGRLVAAPVIQEVIQESDKGGVPVDFKLTRARADSLAREIRRRIPRGR